MVTFFYMIELNCFSRNSWCSFWGWSGVTEQNEPYTFYHTTIQKKNVYAWWKVPAKCFKICHIYYMHIRKPKVVLSIFHFVLYVLYFFPNSLFFWTYTKAFIMEKIKQHEMKNRKGNCGFLYRYLYKIWLILKRFTRTFHQALNLLFLKSAVWAL